MANVNSLIVAIGTIFLSEDNIVPVSLVDTADGWVTGIANTGVNVIYNRPGDASNQTFSPSTSQWKEKGHGLYSLQIPASIFNQSGLFEYAVEPVAAGNKNFRGAAYIDNRVEARLLNAIASGFNSINTVGALVNAAGFQIEVFAGVSYDLVAQTLTWIVFAQLNGQLILTPTSCRVTVKDDADATVCDVTNASPNADGMFKVVASSIVLTAKKAYKVRARMTYNGVEYPSGEMLQSFN